MTARSGRNPTALAYRLRGVSRHFEQGHALIHAVDGIDLDIAAGRLTVIEGPSGSGKTTLLQLLGGLDQASGGVVRYGSDDLTTLNAAHLADLRLRAFGFVFQHFNLIPTLSAAENVAAAAAPLGLNRRQLHTRARKVLSVVGLDDRADHLPSKLSGGEQQRVAIARALATDPDVILADEPTGNLDSRTGTAIIDTLRSLTREFGKTVVLITHDPRVAARADQLVQLRDGQIAAVGTGGPERGSAPAPMSVQTPMLLPLEGELAGGAPAEPRSDAAAPVSNWRPTADVAPATDPILVAEGVRKIYRTATGDVVALHGFTAAINRGEFVTITGRSGSGKTTLLNCLSGLDAIDDGRVLFEDEEVHRMPDARRSRQRASTMGFIFQTWNLIPVFNAVENVELPLLLSGVPGAEARARSAATLDRVGLGHRLGHRPAELSGGEQQRVAVARALAAGPRLVWADEPTGNLDSDTAAEVMALLRELNRDGLTLVLVTHDEQIAASANRRLRMSDGRLAADDTRVPPPSRAGHVVSAS